MTDNTEREAVVAWLRTEFSWRGFREWAGWRPWRWVMAIRMRDCFETAHAIADAVSRGDHLSNQEQGK